MKDVINGLIERFRRQHVQARRYVAMMLVLQARIWWQYGIF